MPTPDPGSEALRQAREHGLWGRADSPPEWNRALDGATAGDPILVKDPTDPRDDFFLIPMLPKAASVHRTAWIMLDPTTLKLREAALLDHWKSPAFPEENEADLIAQSSLLLPDGTKVKFPASALKPNHRNLVWRASDASILPYWPLKEWLAPHPVTGEIVSIYVTQEGDIFTELTDSLRTPLTASVPPPRKGSRLRASITLLTGVLLCIGITLLWPREKPTDKHRNQQDTPTAVPRLKSNEPQVETPSIKRVEKEKDREKETSLDEIKRAHADEIDKLRNALQRSTDKAKNNPNP